MRRYCCICRYELVEGEDIHPACDEWAKERVRQLAARVEPYDDCCGRKP